MLAEDVRGFLEFARIGITAREHARDLACVEVHGRKGVRLRIASCTEWLRLVLSICIPLIEVELHVLFRQGT